MKKYLFYTILFAFTLTTSIAVVADSATPRDLLSNDGARQYLFMDCEEDDEEFLCDEGADTGETLVTYQVRGNQIANPRFEPLNDPARIVWQKDAAKHRQIWTHFANLIPAERRAMVSQFVIFSDGRAGTLAAVEPDENDPTKWILAIDIADADDKTELTHTLIHEYGHLLTLNASQVPPNVAVIYSDNPREFNKAKRACKQYFTGEGCSLPNSYINAFYSRFWRDLEREWERMTRGGEDEEGLERFYAKYRDRFVSDYAVTAPEEDLAEAWTHFVLQPKPRGKTIAEQKVLFFYAYPELTQLRAHIRAQ
jgi:hypothetical protein